MYSNGTGLGAGRRYNWEAKSRRRQSDETQAFRTGKRFVTCICPKCAIHHNVYMLWTGRGVPRKYCGNCKPLVSGYDNAVLHEAAVYSSGHSRRRGRRPDED